MASEVDHLSDVILPTVRDSSIDDFIDDAVNESPLLSPNQREILRSLLKHYQDTFVRCLDYVGTTNYKSFQNDLKPESSMIKSKPYDLGIAMNGISGRKLERYVRAAKLIPGDPACSLPVFLVCVPNEKGSSQVEELRRYFQLQCHT